jgi:hypothetical protein
MTQERCCKWTQASTNSLKVDVFIFLSALRSPIWLVGLLDSSDDSSASAPPPFQHSRRPQILNRIAATTQTTVPILVPTPHIEVLRRFANAGSRTSRNSLITRNHAQH